MPRRVLFVIRGKLGDTLVAFATVRRYADTFPNDEVTLLTRSGYAELLSREKGIRVLGFSSRISMFLLLFRLRFGSPFDALLVLWGFGAPIKWIGQLVRARRKIYLDARYSRIFTEYADLSPHRLQSEPMWLVARLFEPALPRPDRLYVPSLAAKRSVSPGVIGVAPLADEPRRIMSAQMLSILLRTITRRHPDAPVRVFVNATDRGARELIAAGLPSSAEFWFFPQLSDLVRGFSDLMHIYCTDTGLYHLAASMGVPATVYYGPTQPWRNMMPAQPAARGVRLTVLGTEHCEEKSCESALCIEAAIRAVASDPDLASLDGTPPGCPLRIHPPAQLSKVTWHENPSNQA
jgi:ADP-heptose:LPS heptosyltransferase